jgi:hypothetical protein|tara:strand:- start:1709 stop:1918 length:210 start_codon:yes stop_codon:yes gene_type:complete
MKKLTREEKRQALSLKMSASAGAKKIAAARRTNTATEYDSESLIKRSERTAEKRAASLLKMTKSFAGND